MNKTELRDLGISYVTISLAFAIVLGTDFLNFMSFAEALPISLIAVGTGFILHELAHRQVAKHFGAHAEFRAWTFGLILSIALPIISLGRFLFAAPGAVYIYGENIDRRQNGLISLAGPLTNIIIAFLFFAVFLISANPIARAVALPGVFINGWLALFNLLPIPPLDGSKVIAWNPVIWFACFAPLVYFFFFVPL